MSARHVVGLLVTLLSLLSTGAGMWAMGIEEDPIIPRQAMIRLAAGFHISDFNEMQRTSLVRSIRSRNIHLITIPKDEPDEEVWKNALIANPPAGLVWVELNYEGQDGEGRTGSFYVSSIEAASEFGSQYTWTNVGRARAHQFNTGAGTTIAILDTGIDPTHPLIAEHIVPGGFNFIERNFDTRDLPDFIDNDGDGLIDESFGHGTFISGLVLGLAPDTRLLPIKVLNSDGHGDNFIFAEGLFHAIDRGVDVINASLGSTYKSEAVEDAIDEAVRAGIVVVGAAGNQNTSQVQEFPSNVSDAIGVASVDENDIKSRFSNFHDKISLSAPGTGIYSSIPRNSEGHEYALWEGTSLSTAVVSGAAALLIAQHPEWPTNEGRTNAVLACLADTAVDLDGLNPPYRRQLGEGRIDVGAAMTCVPDEAAITDLNVILGQVLGGDVTALIDDSDGEELEVASQFGFSAAEPNIVQLVVGFYSFAQPQVLTIEAWSRTRTTPGARGRIAIRNWTSGLFEPLQDFQVSHTGYTMTILMNVPAAHRVRSDHRLELQFKHSVVATFSAGGFRSLFDLLEVDLD